MPNEHYMKVLFVVLEEDADVMASINKDIKNMMEVVENLPNQCCAALSVNDGSATDRVC